MRQKRTQTDNRRSRWFADPRLQCGLLARTILYWLYSVCTIGAIALAWIVFARHPQTPAEWIDQLALNCGPLAVGSLLILPFVFWDCLRFSQRFAGPMVRFRRALHDLANGDPTNPVELREGDFWCEFARDLNRVSQRLQDLEADTRSKGAVVGASKIAADSTYDAMEETVDFIPPHADAANPQQTEAKSSLAEIAATATSPGLSTADGLPTTAVNIYG